MLPQSFLRGFGTMLPEVSRLPLLYRSSNGEERGDIPAIMPQNSGCKRL
jgi:hypothetical protein